MENAAFHDPDQEILGYLGATFTKEYKEELTTSLSVLYTVEYQDIQEKLLGALNGPESDDPEVLSCLMDTLITSSMDHLFELQGVEINPEAPLQLKNAIATSLLMVGTLEDPVPYLRILETDLTAIEKLARIVESLTTVTEIAVLDAIVNVSESTLTRLYTTLEKQEARQSTPDDVEVNPKHLDQFKAFCAYVGKDHIGYQMLENNFKFGQAESAYRPYVLEHLGAGSDINDIATQVLSYYLIAGDTWEAPLDAFRRDSEILLSSSRDIPLVETQMRKILESLEQYKRTCNESV